MIDKDIYFTNPYVEELLKQFKAKVKKDYCPIKIYISTASQDNYLFKKLYSFYNNTELMEE